MGSAVMLADAAKGAGAVFLAGAKILDCLKYERAAAEATAAD